jgi:chromosome segregation ATPase
MRGDHKLQSIVQVHSEMLQLQRALTQMEQQLATRDRQYGDLQRALDLIQRAMLENDEQHRATEAENARLQAWLSSARVHARTCADLRAQRRWCTRLSGQVTRALAS